MASTTEDAGTLMQMMKFAL